METMYYLFTTMRAFPTIEWRYIVIPKESLPNYPGLALVCPVLIA
jgi:hypothetical protein